MRAGYDRAVELLAAEDRDAADPFEEAAPFAFTYLGFPTSTATGCAPTTSRSAPAPRSSGAPRWCRSSRPSSRWSGSSGLSASTRTTRGRAQNLMDARGLRKGYESPGLPAAGEGAIGRVLMLVEVAFMDKLGKVA